MLQSELSEAAAEYRQEIDAEMHRMVRQAEAGESLDLVRFSALSVESSLLTHIMAIASGLDKAPNAPKAEVRYED